MYIKLFDPQAYERCFVRIGFFFNIKTSKKKIFIIGSPTYNNLGDQAIALAQEKFIKNHIKNRKLIIVPDLFVDEFLEKYGKNIQNEDIITFPGGGNFGNLYQQIEAERQSALLKIKKISPKAKVIIFPQSINFLNDKITFDINKIYKNVKIFAREKKSLEFATEYLNINGIGYAPDIVISLQDYFLSRDNKINNKETIGLISRNDFEAVPSTIKNDSNLISGVLNKELENFDTVVHSPRIFSSFSRYRILFNFSKKIQRHELIFTDRLHGMILSVINRVPVVVYDNSTKKISSTYYSWLRNCNLIYLVDDTHPFNKEDFLKWYKSISTRNWDDAKLGLAYSELLKELNSEK